MRMLALQMRKNGHKVSGTDLRQLSVPGLEDVFLQDGQIHLPEEIDTVVINSDIPEDQPDLKEARRRNLKVIHRLELQDEFLKEKETVIITGSSGKTSSTYYTYSLLKELGMNPFAFIGASLENGQTHMEGETPYVIELTESDLGHTKLKQSVGVLLNYSLDHFWNYAPTREEAHEIYKKEYKNFLDNSEMLIYNGDDEIFRDLCSRRNNCHSYGYEIHNDLRVSDAREEMWHLEFKINNVFFRCNLHGIYSIYNVLAAVAVVHFKYKFSLAEISEKIGRLSHVHRRMTKLYEDENLTIIDDHATFVDEFKALLSSTEKFKKPISIIYESPRIARFRNFTSEFVEILKNYRTAVRQQEVFDTLKREMNVTLIDTDEKIDDFLSSTQGICLLCYFSDKTRPYYLKWIEKNKHRNLVKSEEE